MTKTQRERFEEKFIRRHFSTFTPQEKAILDAKIAGLDDERMSVAEHFIDRRIDYRVTNPMDAVIAAVKVGTVIDYSRDIRNRPIERFLIRDMTRSDVHLVVVIHHERGEWCLVTGWENDPDDMHETLDTTLYERTFDITDCIDRKF